MHLNSHMVQDTTHRDTVFDGRMDNIRTTPLETQEGENKATFRMRWTDGHLKPQSRIRLMGDQVSEEIKNMRAGRESLSILTFCK